jgi:hypothetical protein
MTIKTMIYPEVETVPSDLVDHNQSQDLNIRIMNTLSGSSVICIVMEEMDDSFLVALPCKLVAKGETKVIEPYILQKFVRMFTSTIITAIPCFGEFELFYIEWLLENGNSLYPEYVDGPFLEELRARLRRIKNEADKLTQNLEGIAEKKVIEEAEESLPLIMTPPSTNTRH